MTKSGEKRTNQTKREQIHSFNVILHSICVVLCSSVNMSSLFRHLMLSIFIGA